jgi:DNA-directed RNA polymerase subunit K/omega
VIRRPDGMGAYQFTVLAALRAAQLMRGCVPRVDTGDHKPMIVAQMEISQGKLGEQGPTEPTS